MYQNKLKLNSEKTECIVLEPQKRRSRCGLTCFEFDNTNIPIVDKVKDLGVIIDSDVSLDDHVSYLMQSCFAQLRTIGHIRSYLTTESATTLVLSLVISRIDYCNSLLAGTTKTQIRKLQRIQNAAARVVTQSRKSDDALPLLHSLHWLPIHYRIQFKLLCLTFR